MIDIKYIENNLEKVKRGFEKRGLDITFDELLQNDKKRKNLILDIDKKRHQKNEVSKEIARLKKEKKSTAELVEKMKNLGKEISSSEKELERLKEKIYNFLIELPNIPDEDVPSGGKENNKVLKTVGKKPKFNFDILDHVKLSEKHRIIDYKKGVKLSGRGSWVYSGIGAQLEWAILNFFIEEHLKDGYEFMLVPHILKNECGFGAGQFPKFKDDVFILKKENEKDVEQFLLPTAETAFVNLHAGEILNKKELPKKYFGYTPCYRKEIGSYRTEERGMIRGKQFNKVEMFQFTKPEDSDAAFNELVSKAETLLKKLGLHYRVSKLAAGDVSASMARTYDIETWIPSMQKYQEVSSVSNAREYQARRSNTKYKDDDGKNKYLHMLNGSGLATSRIIPAILEQNQQKDGSIKIPKVLVKYFGKKYLK
ncbi:MAG: serine--tRNA ligase [Candidatus Woesearchaeota archaeon]